MEENLTASVLQKRPKGIKCLKESLLQYDNKNLNDRTFSWEQAIIKRDRLAFGWFTSDVLCDVLCDVFRALIPLFVDFAMCSGSLSVSDCGSRLVQNTGS